MRPQSAGAQRAPSCAGKGGMTSELEYAIKKDIRNNPVVRETDARQKREFLSMLLLVALFVAALLFSAKWATNMRLTGIRVETLRQDLESERSANRTLRLNLEAMRAPKAVEDRARARGFRQPTLGETAVIELAPETSPSGDLVARAH